METRYRLNVDFDNTIVPFLYEDTGEYSFTVPETPNFMGSRYVVFLPAVLVLNDISMIPAISGYTRIEGGIPLTGEFRTIAAEDYESLLLKDAIEFPSAAAGADLTLTNFWTIGSTVNPVGDTGPTQVDITADSTLAANTVNYISASAVVTLTLPKKTSKGQSIVIIDKTGLGFKLKRDDYTVQTLTGIKYKLLPNNLFNEYFKTATARIYSAWTLICSEDDVKWQEISDIDLVLVGGNGYTIGGGTGGYPITILASIERMVFLTEVNSAISATLDAAQMNLGGAAVSSVKGYVGGASWTDDYFNFYASNWIDDLKFSDETSTRLSAVLTSARGVIIGTQSGTAGYFMGGEVGPITYTTSINKLLFSTEAISALSDSLDYTLASNYAVETSLAGYTGRVSTSEVTTIQKLTFETEATSTISATTSRGGSGAAGVSSSYKGYITGSTFANTVIMALLFETEVTSVITATLTTGRTKPAPLKSPSFGYFAGGGNTNTISKLIYSTEAEDNITATLAVTRGAPQGVSGMAA